MRTRTWTLPLGAAIPAGAKVIGSISQPGAKELLMLVEARDIEAVKALVDDPQSRKLA